MISKSSLLSLFFIVYLFQDLAAFELSIAAIFQDEEPYLIEWIEFHRMIGVEHFWLYNDSKNDQAQEILRPFIEAGVVELFDWPKPQNLPNKVNQLKAYKDALSRATGKTEWLALIDLDEYLLPLANKTITECLREHFSRASGIYINWHNFGTSGLYIPEGEPILFQLTSCAPEYHPRNTVGKSIVRPERVLIDESWMVHFYILEKDGLYFNGDGVPINYRKDDKNELDLDGRSHKKFIRINHYYLRDENFFQKVKYPRLKTRASEAEIVEHYESFSKEKDYTLINFILKFYPEMYEKIWKPKMSLKN